MVNHRLLHLSLCRTSMIPKLMTQGITARGAGWFTLKMMAVLLRIDVPMLGTMDNRDTINK